MLQANGPYEYALCLVIALLMSGEIALAYALYRYPPESWRIAVPRLLGLFAGAVAVSGLLYACLFLYGISFIDTYERARDLSVALDDVFLQIVLLPIAENPLLILLGVFVVGGVAAMISGKGPRAPLILGALLWISVFATDIVWFASQTYPLSTVIAEAPDVPLYPGAERVLLDSSSDAYGNWHDITFEVPAEPEAVLSFYRSQLPEHGWRLLPQQDLTTTVTFLRRTIPTAELTTTQQLQWDYELSVTAPGASNTGVVGTTGVEINAARLPDLDWIPVIPGAQDIERTSMISSQHINATGGTGYGPSNVKIYDVKFVAQTDTTEAVQWYDKLLIETRWWSKEDATAGGTTGIQPSAGGASAHYSYQLTQSNQALWPPSYAIPRVDLVITAISASRDSATIEVQATSVGLP